MPRFQTGQRFFAAQFRDQRQQAQPCLLAAAFQPQRIAHARAQHLQAAAHAHHRAAAGKRQTPQCRVQPLRLQPAQIPNGVLAAGQNEHVRRAHVRRRAHHTQPHIRFAAQGVHIGEIADMRQIDHRHVQQLFRRGGGGAGGAELEAHGIFFRQAQAFQPRHHPQKRLARARGDVLQRGSQQAGITAKFIQNKSGNPVALIRLQQKQRAGQRRKGPAAVNIRRQQHPCAGVGGHAHIHNVMGLQVDFRRTARPFQHHHVHFGGKAVIGGGHSLPRARFVTEIFRHAHLPHGAAHDDDLRSGIRIGLEQHGVHAHVRRAAGGGGLQGLRAAYFAAVFRHERIKRHVLRLERRHAQTALRQQAAQRRRQQTFAGVGAGSLQHDGGGERRHGITLTKKEQRQTGGSAPLCRTERALRQAEAFPQRQCRSAKAHGVQLPAAHGLRAGVLPADAAKAIPPCMITGPDSPRPRERSPYRNRTRRCASRFPVPART